jgi:hypothetical protein
LTANKETIYERLRKRGEEEGNWCFHQTDKCIKAFNENSFGEYINTETVNIADIIERIKAKINLD